MKCASKLAHASVFEAVTHGKGLECPDEIAFSKLWFTCQFDGGQAWQQLFEESADLSERQQSSKAKMCANAEGEVTRGWALYVELVWIGEDAFVAVGRRYIMAKLSPARMV